MALGADSFHFAAQSGNCPGADVKRPARKWRRRLTGNLLLQQAGRDQRRKSSFSSDFFSGVEPVTAEDDDEMSLAAVGVALAAAGVALAERAVGAADPELPEGATAGAAVGAALGAASGAAAGRGFGA
jgi:hypothetical protein